MVVGYQEVRNGVFYNYQKAGKGPVITFRHGLGDDSSIFQDLVEIAHKQGCSTLTLDSPGHGYSNHGSVIKDDFTNLTAILDACNIAKTHLVGFSLGATQSLNFAYKEPNRVERLLLLAPVFFDSEYLRLQPRSLLPIYELMKRVYSPPTGDRNIQTTDFREGSTNLHKAVLERVRATGIASIMAALKELEELCFPDYLKELYHPIHIIAGKRDQLAKKETIARLQEELPNTTRVTWLDTGHVIIKEDKEKDKTIEALLQSVLCH